MYINTFIENNRMRHLPTIVGKGVFFFWDPFFWGRNFLIYIIYSKWFLYNKSTKLHLRCHLLVIDCWSITVNAQLFFTDPKAAEHRVTAFAPFDQHLGLTVVFTWLPLPPRIINKIKFIYYYLIFLFIVSGCLRDSPIHQEGWEKRRRVRRKMKN